MQSLAKKKTMSTLSYAFLKNNAKKGHASKGERIRERG